MSGSALPLKPSPGSDASRGFTKRAERVVSNAALFDLVQDMATVLDTKLPEMDAKLDRILSLLETEA